MPSPAGFVPDYCNNPAYDWQGDCYQDVNNASIYNSTRCESVRLISNSWYVQDAGCIQFDGHGHTVFRDSSALARTFISRYYYNCTDLKSSTVASGATICLNRTYNIKRESFFLQGVDDFSMMMQHSVSSSFLQGLLVPTNIYDTNDNLVMQYPSGAIVGYGITMRDWLGWGGASLEETVGPLEVSGSVIPGPPRRSSGAVV